MPSKAPITILPIGSNPTISKMQTLFGRALNLKRNV